MNNRTAVVFYIHKMNDSKFNADFIELEYRN